MEQKIRALVEATAKKFSLPSISVSVLADGKQYHIAYGKADVEANVDATPDSIYCIGSSTKAFIATAVYILAREGKIDLDKPVKDVLPWFRMYDPHMSENLTPRDALAHRSGMPRHDLTWLNTPGRTTRELVEALAYLPPAWDGRYRFHYQNHMFMLITVIVEELSKMPWGEFVRERILKPLQMNDTYSNGTLVPDDDPRKARPYAIKGGETVRRPYNYAVSAGGAGSIYSCTRDMLKWLRFRLEGNDKILDGAALKDMHTPQMVIKPGEMSPISFDEIDFNSYGLAWFIESYRGVRAVHHGGTIDGFKSEQLFAPSHGISVSALCNLNGTTAMSSICYKVLDLLLDLTPIDWDTRYFDAAQTMAANAQAKSDERMEQAKAAAKSGADAAQYAGTYEHPAYGELVLEAKNGELWAKFIGLESKLLYAGADNFVMANERHGTVFPAEFIRKNGEICAVEIPLDDMVKHIPARFDKK